MYDFLKATGEEIRVFVEEESHPKSQTNGQGGR